MQKQWTIPAWILPALFITSRVVVYLLNQPNGSDGFGDMFEYYGMAKLTGWPFFGYWVEYPPAFAFLNELVFLAAKGQSGDFYFLFSMLLALAGSACVYLFQKIAVRIYGYTDGALRSLTFFGMVLLLPYTWWSYDLIPLTLLLAGLDWHLGGSGMLSGISLGLGILIKWFPGFLIPALLRYRPGKLTLKALLVSVLLFLVVICTLWIVSPEMTKASLASQPLRTSWQTVWAYLDGNRVSGYFVYYDWRYDPAQAYVPRGNLAQIPNWMTLLIFGGIGLFCFWRVRNLSERSLIAFLGLTFALFFMWSQGWSPQWIIFLLAPVLLTLPLPQAVILNLTLLGICLFEWPYALGQYWFRAVFAMAGLRMLAFSVLGILWYRIIRLKEEPPMKPVMGGS